MFGNRIDIFYRDTSDGRSFFDFILYIAKNGTVTTATGNQFRITYTVGFDQYILDFSGSNFVYGPNGPIAGNLFSLDIINFARPLYTSSGYDSSSLATMWTAIRDSLFFGTEAPLSNHFDTFEQYITGTGLGDEIFGGALGDVISGINGNDVINGLDGNDVIGGGNGEDIINGGFGNDNINGDAGNDILFGDAGGDILRGNAGTDELHGGTGNDSLEGGDENDVLYGDAGTDRLNGGNGDDIVYGGDDADIVGGGADADTLYGQSGNDRLFGDAGNDILYGGAGADVLDGGTEIDLVYYDNPTTGIYARLDGVVGASGEAVGDTFVSIEGLVGSAFNDVFVGNNVNSDLLSGMGGADSLYGLGGNDTLDGSAGNDSLYGGAGADVLNGGSDFDLARYDSASTAIYTRLDGVAGQYGEAVGDTYIGIEGLVGSAFNDTFVGNNVSSDSFFGLSGNDGLYGLGGADYLDGGLGNDTLVGGTGADRFVFSTALGATNVDTIIDFAAGSDDIVLSQAIFAGIGATLDAAEFQIGTADAATDRIIYNQVTGQLYYDVDGNGAGGSTLFATVTAGTALTLADFVMVA